MSHGIATERDFQISEEIAWHKLTKVKTPELSDMPEIVKMPLHFPNGEIAKFGEDALYLPVSLDDGKACGNNSFTDSYSLFTPRDAWKWVNEVLAGTGYKVESCGMLWNRSFWFISTRLAELQDASIGDGRESRFMFNFSGGLDKMVSPQAELSNIVAVCHNTISLSRMTGEVLFKTKATKNFNNRLEAAKADVEKAVGMAALFKKQMDSLAKKPCDVKRAERIFAGYLAPKAQDGQEITRLSTRTKNTIDTLAGLHVRGIGNQGKSEFDLLNAYTELMSRGTADAKTSPMKRFAASEFGNARDDKADFAALLAIPHNRPKLAKIEERGEMVLSLPIGKDKSETVTAN